MISRILAAAAEGEAAPNPLLPASYDILWSSVVFFILLAFFWFKVLPNFKKTLDARTEAIEGRLEAAEKAQAEAELRPQTLKPSSPLLELKLRRFVKQPALKVQSFWLN